MQVKIETQLTITIAGAEWKITKQQAEELYFLLGEELKLVPHKTVQLVPIHGYRTEQ